MNSKRLFPQVTPANALSRTSRIRGFSLIEVVLALGIVSFSMLAILGLLPIGLTTAQDSMNQTAVAIISQQIRGELEQVSFNSSSKFYIGNLGSITPTGGTPTFGTTPYSEYYTLDGVKTTAIDPAAYYQADFAIASPVAADAFTVGGANALNSARNVQVKLSYPKFVTGAGKKSVYFSLFAAKQNND